jgi:replicative DNA helicase
VTAVLKLNVNAGRRPLHRPKLKIVTANAADDYSDVNPEELLLSAILNTADHQQIADQGVSEDWFSAYDGEMEFIQSFIRLNRKVPDHASFMKRHGDFNVWPTTDLAHWIEEVRKQHANNTLIAMSESVLDMIEDERDPLDCAEAMEKAVLELRGRIDSRGSEADVMRNWEITYDEVARRAKRIQSNGIAGVATGFRSLDRWTGGPQPGEFWVINARLGVGKTWIALMMAKAAALSGEKVHFNSLEMSKSQINVRLQQLIAAERGITGISDIGRASGMSLKAYRKFCRELAMELPDRVIINDTTRGGVTTATMAAQIERNLPSIMFVDYIGLMEQDGDWQAIKRISGECKMLAGRYQIPIVMLAQQNRGGAAVGKKDAGTENIAGSDAIGQDADCVLTITRTSKHTRRIRNSKYRHGEDGQKLYVEFAPGSGIIREVDHAKWEGIKDTDAFEDGDEA